MVLVQSDGSSGPSMRSAQEAEELLFSSDEDDGGDDEVIREYVGGLDGAGCFHGRATVHYESGDTFRGRFAHGLRDGRGTVEFEDGSTQTGRYCDDELEGTVVYSFPSGESIVAQYVNSVMQGPFEERNSDGSVACSGTMLDGVRAGRIHFSYPDGGSLRGVVDEHGAVTGEGYTYLYPDGSGLCGRWEDGEMVAAVFHTAEEIAALEHAAVDQPAPPKKQRRADGPPPTLLRYDPGTAQRLSSNPSLQDHYEAARVEAKQSRISGANEGLFARTPLEDGEVACFYAGVRVSHDLVDNRDWIENDNTMSVDDETVIDVPPQCAHLLAYHIPIVARCLKWASVDGLVLSAAHVIFPAELTVDPLRCTQVDPDDRVLRDSRAQSQSLLHAERSLRAVQSPSVWGDQVHSLHS